MAGKPRRTQKSREIGARIAEARKEAGGMSQRELGELIGVSERSVAAYEVGDVIPYRYFTDIERVTGASAAWLLHGDTVNDVRDQQYDEILKLLRSIIRKLDDR